MIREPETRKEELNHPAPTGAPGRGLGALIGSYSAISAPTHRNVDSDFKAARHTPWLNLDENLTFTIHAWGTIRPVAFSWNFTNVFRFHASFAAAGVVVGV
jgi:hypothetical protein